MSSLSPRSRRRPKAIRPGLTACMIAREERANLEEILPLLVQGADAVVLVDTGSRDGTVEFARAAGARVLEEPWREDFSRARNRGLEAVRTSHVLWLDADDRLSAEALERVRAACRARPRCAWRLLLVNESDRPERVTSCRQLRVFPADVRHRFEGRVHEQIAPALARTGTPIGDLDVTIRHTGYRDPQEVLRKARRNLALLRRELAAGESPAPSLLYHAMRAASQCGHREEAARYAGRLLEEFSPNGPAEILCAAAVELARIELARHRPGAAESILRESLRQRPDEPLARLLLAECLRQRGAWEAARKELEAARACPARASSLPRPLAGVRRAVRRALGEVLEALGRPGEAAELYAEALVETGEDPELLLAQARALAGAGRVQAARTLLDRLEHNGAPPGPQTLIRALAAFVGGEAEEAEHLFAEAEGLLPDAWAAPLHRGHLALRRGEHEAARAHYARALALRDCPESHLGMAACELEGGSARSALEHLARVVEGCGSRPLPPGTEALAGEAFLRLGRLPEARTALERHLRRCGPEPRVLSRLADCYREMGALEAARLGYCEALRLAPGLEEARAGLSALPDERSARGDSAQEPPAASRSSR